MKKNVFVRAVVFLTAFGMTCLAAALVYGIRAAGYERMILAANENAFYELVSSAERMAEDISTLKYGTSGLSLAETASRIWGDSRAAESSLAALTLRDDRLSLYKKLINQAGDYSLSLLKQAADGAPITPEQLDTLDTIGIAAKAVCEKLTAARELMECGLITFDSLGESISGADLSNVNVIVYDGVFSDPSSDEQIGHKRDENAVSREEARSIAEEFTGEQVSPAYETKGLPAVFGFSFGDGGVIEISELGGHILTLSRRALDGEARLSPADAKSVFLSECESLGHENMTCRRVKDEGKVISAELVPFENGVYLYPDAVKLSISAEDGKLIRADCKDYFANHRERDTVLTGTLPEGASFALLRSDGGNEVLCHELFCDGVLTYLNPEIGSCRRFTVLSDNETFLTD